MSYLITGIIFSLTTWFIVRDKYKKESLKGNILLKDRVKRQKEIITVLLHKNNLLARQNEELRSEIVVIKSMKGE